MIREVNILLVEDDKNDILAVQRAFKKNQIGNPLFVVENGEEALDFCRYGLNGSLRKLSDFAGQIVVVQFGSSTSPGYVGNIDPLNETMARYLTDNVIFITVYSTEYDLDAVEGAPNENSEDRKALAGQQKYELERDGKTIEGTKQALKKRSSHE